jgi:hypothetical protein
VTAHKERGFLYFSLTGTNPTLGAFYKQPAGGQRMVPVKAALCGLLAAESMTCRVSLLTPIPAFSGVKVTVMEQFAPAPNVEPQVFAVTLNGSLKLAPMLVMVMVDVPVLVSVTVLFTGLSLWYQVPKFTEVGESEALPVPVDKLMAHAPL